MSTAKYARERVQRDTQVSEVAFGPIPGLLVHADDAVEQQRWLAARRHAMVAVALVERVGRRVEAFAQSAILDGRLAPEVTLADIMKPFPICWKEQKRLLGNRN